MDAYVTGATIKTLREKKELTQENLAKILGVSSKAVSKWETGKGFPDISLLEFLAKALGVCVTELLSGNAITNQNLSSNVARSRFYLCPVCGNIIRAMGNAAIHCCGISLPPLEAEEADEHHRITIEQVEDEHFITVCHPMTKEHYISFLAYITCDRVQFVKFYPEGNAETRIQLRGKGTLYFYCNQHGLFKMKP